MLAELGYGFAYRVLDAQYVRTRGHAWAVPQRRRRVFVVGYFGDWRRAAAVLFDGESLSGNPAPRREAGQGIARGIELGPSGGDFTEVNPTLDARAKDGPIRNQLAGAVLCSNSGDVGYCLTSSGQQSLDAETETETLVAVQASQSGVRVNETVGTLDANYGSRRHNGVMQDMQVRRLTPRECERLQAFPDDFTRIPYRGKPADQCPDGPRYKALGNSMAVNVMEWIGERIQIVESAHG